MKVTIREVAKKAGVSPATVSRVISQFGYVSEATRNKVLTTIRELGYRPNTIARSMVTKATHTIGLVVTDITNPFFAQLARGVEEITWNNGYTLILANTDEDVARECAIIQALQEKQVDALIIVPASSNNAPHLFELLRQGIPIVLVDREVTDLPVDKVMVDNEEGAYNAVSHLIKLGHSRIAILLDNPDITTNVERLNGYKRALKENNISINEDLIRSCQYTQQSAYEIIKEILHRPDRPSALFTANNFMTIGAIKAIHETGLHVPQDLALVGFDDLEYEPLNASQLTVVSQPITAIGNIAGQRIISKLRGDNNPPMEIRLKTHFIVRESCGASPKSNKESLIQFYCEENMPDNLEQLVEKARQSKLFTAPVLGPDMARFLQEQSPAIRAMAKRAIDEKIEHIYWVGSGNSWLNLYSGKYLLDKFAHIPSDCFTSYELVWRNPTRLNNKSWVFLASFSGATEDTVVALRHAKERQAHTIALVDKADSLMGQEADEVIPYNSKALYILPLAFAYLFSLEVARLQGNKKVQEVIDGLFALPPLLSQQYIDEEAPAKELAEEFLPERLIYTLGSGPLYGLAYKFGLTVFMENMRVNGSFMDASEFRHGPVEVFDREKPAMVILLGTDESRPIVQRVLDLCTSNGAHVLTFDMAKYPQIHPLLAPFVLMIPLQWFAVWSSLMRGITDLDERVFMGRGILGKGKGVTWP
jgi:DNA-binding LacI/PurR family transcriptional regulator/fructoselysine-6-P-deglycase FrlB-like protein